MGADVTVIITHCDGVTGEKLVFTSPSGRITGFSGSVGRCGFLTDKADTGIYIISGKILKMLRDRTITAFQMRYCLNCSHKIKVFCISVRRLQARYKYGIIIFKMYSRYA